MKKILFAALASLTLATACKKDDATAPATTMQVSGTLSSANEIPAITPVPAATGSFTGTYDPTTKTLAYTLTFSNLSSNATAAHLHFGDAKHHGAVWLPLTVPMPAATSGTITGSAILTTTAATAATSTSPASPAVSQPDSLTMGHVYANIHTANNGGGEVRANVVVK